MKNTDDSVGAMYLGMSAVGSVRQYRGRSGRFSFIEFPGEGEPGFSGAPVFNNRER